MGEAPGSLHTYDVTISHRVGYVIVHNPSEEFRWPYSFSKLSSYVNGQKGRKVTCLPSAHRTNFLFLEAQ